MTIRMDEGAAELLDTLHRAGYAAYVVGGCVRDSLLGLTPHDWDLCTSALPQQGMELFGEEKCIPTGLQHGTVTVKQGGGLYEITTFRTEGTYTDGRHPDEVHFVPDVREDLARRDFTINAMAYNVKEGLVDPFGGQADLQSGILRAVGVPHQRFTEDALRILRLYRFAARFGFAIDPPTAQAAQELCAHLDCVSVERIEEELAKLLSAPAPAAYLDEKILGVVLPELSPEALAAAKPVVDACPAGERALPVRLAALLLSLGEDGTRRTLRRLRCSNACIEETAVLVREARGRDGSFSEDRPLGWDPVAEGNRAGDGMARIVSEEKATVTPDFTIYARRLLGKYNLCTVQRLAALGTALQPEHAADFAALSELAERLDADGVCCRVSQLAVNGRDLMAAGVPAGPGIRKVLEALLDGVIREEYPNERQALLAAVQQLAAS
ncbi:CCA tRNA nucleotidyltransferase [Faecalibacterium wellingii]|uniref:tRNA nucleotidyltransferase n=1 Tax=Faecalibacterium wellingii TaxID=2929491 RepID=A0ABU3TWQ7_9FIRM|nr:MULTISPECIES: tRNA nucleotidyltransferase [Faecalibacterium]MDU8687713.1 tRNA nucleotidyltransferase [Faecalibacterium prausnitzii]UQK56165.1 tRNA nucleotidyltransferase [Faecalibacterium sp. HTF-F]